MYRGLGKRKESTNSHRLIILKSLKRNRILYILSQVKMENIQSQNYVYYCIFLKFLIKLVNELTALVMGGY